MYTPSQLWRGLRRGIQRPAFFLQECNRLYNRRLYRTDYNTEGDDFMAEDWDNLILLDACRYDLFEDEIDDDAFPGTLEQRQSRGSHTVEFLQGNFARKAYLDTVYITASPQLYRWSEKIDATFHDVIEVWKRDWNDEHGTVMPETMAEFGNEAAELYPHKRLIIHFMQPHYPFINAPSLNVGQRLDGADERDIWGRLRDGDMSVSADQIWQAYRNNLRLTLPPVQSLIDGLSGRTVVSSDHGNMIGERSSPIPIREWGHPPGTYTDELVTVPWQVIPASNRREIHSEQPRCHPRGSGNGEVAGVAKDRLRALGYQE